jgi:probable HAF family extracellular repeat protein
MLKHWRRTLALLGVVAATGLICAAVTLGAKKPPAPSPPPPEPTVAYWVTFLGTFPGDTGSRVTDLNNHGVVVGRSYSADLGYRAFVVMPEDTDGDGLPDLWYRDTDGDGGNDLMVALNDLIDPDSGWDLHVGQGAINNAGPITGTGYNPDGEIRAYRFTPGVGGAWGHIDDLGTLPGGIRSNGLSINDQGDAAGSSIGPDNRARAFLWRDEDRMMVDIGSLGGGGAAALGINNSGWVTGWSTRETYGPMRAFRYTPGMGMEDVGDLTSKQNGQSVGRAINDAGDVVGYSDSATKIRGITVSHAFLYTDEGGMKDLGTLGGSSFAWDVNSDGDVVGYAEDSTGALHGFLYTNKTNTGEPAMFKLHDLLVNPQDVQGQIAAYNINDLGQICGEADGQAVLLIPVSP